jgi:hypothetical protein
VAEPARQLLIRATTAAVLLMSQTWFLLSPIPAKEALAVEKSCSEAIEQFLAEHPECDDHWGELGPGGPVPTPADATEAHRRYRLPLPDSIIERLTTCRSSLAIDRPQGGRYLLKRIGKGLVMFNDYPLLNSNIVLLDLRHHEGAMDFPE